MSLFQIDDLSLIFVHIHHLLNEFRPHQARETLRVMMEMQKRQRVETAKRFEAHISKVRKLVNDSFLNLTEGPMDEDVDMISAIKQENDAKDLASYTKNDPCDISDRIMCKLVDKMYS